MKLWFRVEADASTDTKITQLAAALNLRVPHAFGLVAGVWCGVARHAENGNLADVAPVSLETWAGWHGKSGRFAAEFRKLFVDEDGALHGWAARQGKLISAMEKDRARHRREYEKSRQNLLGESTENPRSFQGFSTDNTITLTSTVQSTGSGGDAREDAALVEGAAPTDPREIAILLTAAGNQGIAARYGEQPSPLVWSSASSAEVVEAVRANQIPVMFARDAIYSVAVDCKQERPPRGLKYFLPQILRAWAEEQARVHAEASPTPKIIALTPSDRRSSEIADSKRAILRGVPA